MSVPKLVRINATKCQDQSSSVSLQIAASDKHPWEKRQCRAARGFLGGDHWMEPQLSCSLMKEPGKEFDPTNTFVVPKA